LKDKNIRKLGSHPLIAYSIAAAKLAGIKEVWVSTDSTLYAEVAREYGAKTPFIRDSSISKDTSTDFEFMKDAIEWCSNNLDYNPKYWMHLRPTTPLRDPRILKNALDIFRKNENLDSLRSAHEVAESPFKWFLKDENNLFEGIRKEFTPEIVNQPRQNFPKAYNPNGYVDVVKSSVVLNCGCLHGNKMYVFETPHCQEIDNADDFEYLEFKFEREGSILNDYLDIF
jgi:N-acylneuraminate cytidylyltransferase